MKQFKKHGWDGLAFVSGALLAMAFAPFEYTYLGIFALVLLFISWQEVSPTRAAIRGFLFGLGLFGLGVSWVFISVYDFGGASLFLAILLTLLFVGFWAFFPALAGYISVKFFTNSRIRTIIIFPVVWILIEYLRGQWIFNGFPWLQIAYSQLDTPLAGYIPILGVYGVGWILALTASTLTTLIIYKDKYFVISLGFILSLWVTGWQLNGISWTHIMGSPIKVTMIQGNIAQDKKWNPEYRNKIMHIYKERTYQHWDSQIIIWPESAVPAYLHQVNEDFLIPLDQEAKKNDTDLIISLPIKTKRLTKFNAVITRGKGSSSEYHKIHLLPFGEYLPLQPFSNYLLSSLNTLPVGSFTAGSIDQPLLKAGGYAFITTICYEDAFGEEGIRDLTKAAFLVNVTNDGWFGDSFEPYQHMQIARMRALEAGRYLLRATNNGVTAFVNPIGKVIKQAPLFTETTLTDDIFPMTGATPYSEYGDKPVIYVLLFLLVSLFVLSKYLYDKHRQN